MDKPAGIPVQPDLTNDFSLLQMAEIYAKRRLHPVTRLDRPASGLTLFAKTPADTNYINDLKKANTFFKRYIAVVEGKLEQKEGELVDFLLHNKKTKKAELTKISSDNHKEAKLKYTVLGEANNYSILEVMISTGRFHQIRAQLAQFGHPIKGDVKYGARRSNEDRIIHLVCYEIKFTPKSGGKVIHCKAQLNKEDKLWALANEILHGKK